MMLSLPKPEIHTLLLWAIFVVTGCSQKPPEAPPEADHSHHKNHHAHHPEGHTTPHNPHEPGTNPGRAGESSGEVVGKAKTVLKYIDEHHEAPKGFEGGKAFHNTGTSSEQSLPKNDDRGRAITYQEWDVNPKVEGVNRGTERLITGSDGSAYLTTDHYKTFSKIR